MINNKKFNIFSDFSTPIYSLTLPSGLSLKYKPFLVKHEKALYYALEEFRNSNDNKIVVDTLKSIFNDCLIFEDETLSVDKLPLFDIEFLILLLRSNSTGDDLSISVLCPDDNKTRVEITIPIDKITFKTYPDHNNSFVINNFLFTLKYPNIDFLYSSFTPNDFDSTIKLIFSLIDTIKVLSTNQTFTSNDIDFDDFYNFLSNLPRDDFYHFVNFINTIPRIYYETKIQNPKTKKSFTVKFEGLSDFLQ